MLEFLAASKQTSLSLILFTFVFLRNFVIPWPWSLARKLNEIRHGSKSCLVIGLSFTTILKSQRLARDYSYGIKKECGGYIYQEQNDCVIDTRPIKCFGSDLSMWVSATMTHKRVVAIQILSSFFGSSLTNKKLVEINGNVKFLFRFDFDICLLISRARGLRAEQRSHFRHGWSWRDKIDGVVFFLFDFHTGDLATYAASHLMTQ